MRYGKGLTLDSVMGGMWSMWPVTQVMILKTVERSVVSVAFRTLARSIF